MTTTDTAQKLNALYWLAMNYGKELPEQLAELWLQLLAPYTAEQVAAAVARVVTEYEYKTMPPFAVLRKALDAGSGQGAEAVEAMAAAEWQRVMAEIERVGSYGNPKGLHETTLCVLRGMGGWDAACQWPVDWLEQRRKEFCQQWVQAHGKAGAMALGADAVKDAIEAESAGAILGRLALGEKQQEVRQ